MEKNTPLPNYLQTAGLDISKAYQNAVEKLKDFRKNFFKIKQNAENFIDWVQKLKLKKILKLQE